MNVNISVIIPVKNRANLLGITLDNVLNQTSPPYEVIVVDDDSSDDIDAVANRFKQNVLFVKSKGKGPGAARNTGYQLVTGNAVQFFDSDDLMTKNKFAVQAALLSGSAADVVLGPYVKVQALADGGWQRTDAIMQYEPFVAQRLADNVLRGWCAITQSALFSKGILDEVGPWCEDLMTHEDYEFWFRVGKLARTIVHENESCVLYRQHNHQVTDLGVSVQKRWLEGLSAMEMIRGGLDFTPQMTSLMVFKGRSAQSKLEYIRRFGNNPAAHFSISDRLCIPFYKIMNKISRLRTGTEWERMHGPSNSEEIFQRYLQKM